MLGRETDLALLEELVTACGGVVPARGGSDVNDRVLTLLRSAAEGLGLTPITDGSWNDQVAGNLELLADNVSGAGGALAWTPLTDVSVPVDGSTSDLLATTGSGYDQDTGRFTIVCGASVTVEGDGYQELSSGYYVLKPLSELIPDFADDPLKYRIEFGIKLATWAHSTAALGIAVGIVDSDTINGSLVGACGAVRGAGAAQDQAQNLGAADNGGTSNAALLDQLFVLIQFNDDGSGNYATQVTISGLTESGTVVTLLNSNGGASGAGLPLRGSTIADWQVAVWYFHDATTTTASHTAVCDVAYRVVELETRPLP